MTKPPVPPLRSVYPTVAAALAIEFLLVLLGPEHAAGAGLNSVSGLLVVAIEVLAFGLPPLLVIRYNHADWRYTLRWHWPNWRYLIPAILAAPALAVVLFYVQAVWGRMCSNLLPANDQALSDVLQAHSPLQVAGLLLLVGVVPAISEEIFFRGFLMRVCESRWRPALAIGLTAALFAVLHFDVFGLPTYVLLGVWFGVLARRSGSLLCPILAHLLHNGLDVVGRNVLSAETFEANAGWMPYAALAGTLAAAIILAFLPDKGSDGHETPDAQP